MIFCELCREKNHWPRNTGYPYAGHQVGKCEICNKSGECNVVPGSMLKPGQDKTFSEKTLDKWMQDGYRQKAEALIVTYVSNGRIDHTNTEQLRQIFAKRNNEVDWAATYELRLKAQEGYRKAEEKRRNQILNRRIQ